MRSILVLALALAALPALANDIGVVKVSRGTVAVERAGQKLPATVGMAVRASDVVITMGCG
ncbi:MAG TPA: hypothetical protein PLD37_12875, partial [Usitatibacteraceae bacterium]|nr:hypothetical protein [Usitatibacteraceae bacterium]